MQIQGTSLRPASIDLPRSSADVVTGYKIHNKKERLNLVPKWPPTLTFRKLEGINFVWYIVPNPAGMRRSASALKLVR